MNAIDELFLVLELPSMTHHFTPSIFSYIIINDCEEIFDGTKNLNFILQNKINNPKDDLSEVKVNTTQLYKDLIDLPLQLIKQRTVATYHSDLCGYCHT